MKTKKPKTKAIRKQTQLTLQSQGWGGQRHGAGRPKQKNSGVAHRERESLNKITPLHITMRLRKNLPSLRTKQSFRIFRQAVKGAKTQGLRVLQFSVLGNHFHLLVEAGSNKDLERGMRSLNNRLTRSINKVVEIKTGLKRMGSIFTDRYHAVLLTSSKQLRRTLAYIFANASKHYRKKQVFDWFSSFVAFKEKFTPDKGSSLAAKDWRRPRLSPEQEEIYLSLLSPPTSWMARSGWKRLA